MQRDGAEHGSAAQEAPWTGHPLAQPAETRRRSAAEESPEREIERAIQLAYRAVGYRERTVAELRTFLERKRVEPCAIEEAVAELRTSGLLDDASYAQRFAQDKRDLDRWGSERIARDLHKRGIAPDLVEAAIATTSRDSELATALLLLEQRLPPPHDDRARDRAWRLLTRRGYEPELAYEAVRRYEHSGGRDARRAA
jgi:regulatory protein